MTYVDFMKSARVVFKKISVTEEFIEDSARLRLCGKKSVSIFDYLVECKRLWKVGDGVLDWGDDDFEVVLIDMFSSRLYS